MRILGTVASSSREVPGAPTIGTATNVGSGRAYNNGRADVTFTAPAVDGGFPILDYTVTSSPGGFTATGASSPLTVTGLQSSVSYTFTVTARTAIGTGPASDASNSITATTVPQAPTIGTAADGGTGTTATVTYTAGATGGAAVSAYTATSSPGSLTGTGASPITVSGLTTGTAYTFTVTATNANGTSAASAASNSVTPVSPSSFDSIATGNPSGVSTFTFSSIPSTYKSLQLRMTSNMQAQVYTVMRFNGVTTGTYTYHALRGDGGGVSAPGGSGTTSIAQMMQGPASNPPYVNAAIVDIIDYASTSKNKTVRCFTGTDENNASTPFIQLNSGVWLSTAAINSITIVNTGGNNFTTGTQFALYGVK